MREIKFRAWDKLNNEWCGIDMAYSDAAQGPISKPTVFNGHNQCVIMQYTGLKDKNGVEIYEGDILGLVHKKHGLSNSKVVVWDEVNACFDWEDANGDSWPDGFTGFYDEYSVIGNIYENEELLK